MGINQKATYTQQQPHKMSYESFNMKPHLKAEVLSANQDTAETTSILDRSGSKLNNDKNADAKSETNKTLIMDEEGHHKGYQLIVKGNGERTIESRRVPTIRSSYYSYTSSYVPRTYYTSSYVVPTSTTYYNTSSYVVPTYSTYEFVTRRPSYVYETTELKPIIENVEYETKSPIVIRSCNELDNTSRRYSIRNSSPRPSVIRARRFSFSHTPKKSVSFLEVPNANPIKEVPAENDRFSEFKSRVAVSREDNLEFEAFKQNQEINLRRLRTQVNELKQINQRMRADNDNLKASCATVI